MTRGHVFGLDLIRALAVAMVLFTHASILFVPVARDLSVFDPWWLPGQLGVELFFVLSGFLIGGILAEQAESGDLDVRQFWIRRWLRTLPNYYLFLVLNLVFERYATGAWPHAWSYVFFWQNLAWPNPPFYPESWSLAIEEIFYLVAPLLIVLAKGRLRRWMRRPVPLMVLGILVFTGIRIAYVLHGNPDWDAGVRKVTLVRLDAIAYGVLAIVLVRRVHLSLRAVVAIACGGLVGTAFCVWVCLAWPRDTSFFARTFLFNLIPLSFAAFLPIAARWKQSGLPRFAEFAVTKLALWSYALYVSHLGLLRVLLAFGWKGATPLECLGQALAYAVMAIVLSALVYHLYERPLLRWRDAIAPKTAPAVA